MNLWQLSGFIEKYLPTRNVKAESLGGLEHLVNGKGSTRTVHPEYVERNEYLLFSTAWFNVFFCFLSNILDVFLLLHIA